jgi:GH15 family glucan-1,4-alpha-glucosidase
MRLDEPLRPAATGHGQGPYPPIADYALLSDCHSAALVSRDGSIDWCCFHRFDARPVFARLLDRAKGGHFRIAPTGPFSVTRRYLPATNVLETRFVTASGVVTVVDCLAVRRGATAGDAGRTRSHHQLLRLVRCDAGQVDVTVEFAPRFDYGLTVPRLELHGDDVGVVYGGADALVLQSELPLTQTDVYGCGATATLHAGDDRFLALTYQLPHQLQVHRLGRHEVNARLQRTVDFWQDWSARCTYHGPYREQVLRSALVLKGLTNAPTGAIVAAPTTSLPEAVGGVRNWDYRYSWLRDAAMNLYALFTLGYTDEAHAFMAWLERTTAGRAEDLQLMYGVGGERLVPEVELAGLDGYRGSRPVRIGNAAANQFQLDAYGYLLDTAWLYHRHGGKITPTFWQLLSGAVDLVARRWTQPDKGIWEVRGRPRHFVSAKVMAWVAVDRAIRLARARGLPADLQGWTALRRAIRRGIEQAGTDPATGAFTQAFGSRTLDASNLLLPLVRFLPPTTPASSPPSNAPPTSSPPTGSSTATWTPTTASRTARRASSSAASGWSATSPWLASTPGPASCSTGCSATPTTSGCSPRRSTRSADSYSATSPKPSATSGSSAPPSTSNGAAGPSGPKVCLSGHFALVLRDVVCMPVVCDRSAWGGGGGLLGWKGSERRSRCHRCNRDHVSLRHQRSAGRLAIWLRRGSRPTGPRRCTYCWLSACCHGSCTSPGRCPRGGGAAGASPGGALAVHRMARPGGQCRGLTTAHATA